MSTTAIRWAGTRALLLEQDSLDAVVAVHGTLAAHPLPGQVEVLAAAETVMVAFDSRASALAGRTELARLDIGAAAGTGGREIGIEVVYDGEDLAEVGRLTGLGAEGVIRAHTSQAWTAAFGGFAPGFAYLHGGNDALNVPRRNTPRTAVPAGSVALAGRFSAVYPSRSPGGWQLIGRTNARMWDLGRDQPALVRPGDTVRYTAVRELVEVVNAGEAVGDGVGTDVPSGRSGDDRAANDAPAHGSLAGGTALTILSPGLQSLIQDLGRPGMGDLGVPASGAADPVAARQANRLVGNPPTDAVIETVLGGLELRAVGALVLALAGAESPGRIDGPHGGRPAPPRAPFALHDDEILRLGNPSAGLRAYLAVRGGLAVPEVLGSRSTDTLSGLGPAPLAAGTSLPVGAVGFGHVVGDPEPSTLALPPTGDGVATLRITPGPRADWFAPGALAALAGGGWSVSTQSNRIGLRLEPGPGQRPLQRIREGELASEGTATGSLQVPPSGLPVLFLSDHPVTGGYPVVAVVVPQDLPAAAQLVPGTPVRFLAVDPDTLLPAAADTDTPPAAASADPQ